LLEFLDSFAPGRPGTDPLDDGEIEHGRMAKIYPDDNSGYWHGSANPDPCGALWFEVTLVCKRWKASKKRDVDSETHF
jgi:hypothetical protein